MNDIPTYTSLAYTVTKKLQSSNVTSRNTIKLKNKAEIRIVVENITKQMLTTITRE